MKAPMPRRRKFTDEFQLGQRVYVIRHRHGWEDGGVQGHISALVETQATVTDPTTGLTYHVDHCRDLQKI